MCAVLLDTSIVEYSEVTGLINDVFASPDLNGPVECDAAATQLWHVLLNLREPENITSVNALSAAILSWLFNRWSPCMINVAPIPFVC